MIIGEFLEYPASTLDSCALLYSAQMWAPFSKYDFLHRPGSSISWLTESNVLPIPSSPGYWCLVVRGSIGGSANFIVFLFVSFNTWMSGNYDPLNPQRKLLSFPANGLSDMIYPLTTLPGAFPIPSPNLCYQYPFFSSISPPCMCTSLLWFLHHLGIYDIQSINDLALHHGRCHITQS